MVNESHESTNQSHESLQSELERVSSLLNETQHEITQLKGELTKAQKPSSVSRLAIIIGIFVLVLVVSGFSVSKKNDDHEFAWKLTTDDVVKIISALSASGAAFAVLKNNE